MGVIGLYHDNAIAIESEANNSCGGNVQYVTMQITLPFWNLRVTNVIFIVTYYRLPQIESPDSSWMTQSQRSRRRDKGLWRQVQKLKNRALQWILNPDVVIDALVLWQHAALQTSREQQSSIVSYQGTEHVGYSFAYQDRLCQCFCTWPVHFLTNTPDVDVNVH